MINKLVSTSNVLLRYFKSFILLLTLSVHASSFATCGDGLTHTPTGANADAVMIITNINETEGCAIAKYYADKRLLNPDNIIEVHSPHEYFITWDQFLILRDQVLQELHARVIADHQSDLNFVTASCSGTSHYCEAVIDQVRKYTKIKYLVTTRGIATRMQPSPDAISGSFLNEYPSVDGHLARTLMVYTDPVTDEWNAFNQYPERRPQDFEDGRFMRKLVVDSRSTAEDALPGYQFPGTFQDLGLLIARLDGNTVLSVIQQIDRTLEAENEGVRGAQFSHSAMFILPSSYTDDYYAKDGPFIKKRASHVASLWGESRMQTPNCVDDDNPNFYFYNMQDASNDSGKSPPECLVQYASSVAPSKPKGRQPLPTNALTYLGYLDGQSTSSGDFEDFLNWRKTDNSNCQTMCDPTDSACVTNSEDIHNEINTACVGLAKGFIGYNYQSYPVAFFSSWPTDWFLTSVHNEEGQNIPIFGQDWENGSMRARPFVVEAQNGDKVLQLGSVPSLAGSTCFPDRSLDSASLAVCEPTYNGFQLAQVIDFDQPRVSGLHSYNLSFRYQTLPGFLTPQGHARFVFSVAAFDATNPGAGGAIPNITYDNEVDNDFFTPTATGQWETAQLGPIEFDADTLDNWDSLQLILYGTNGFKGAFLIDDIELTEERPGPVTEQLLSNTSFDQGHSSSAAGDWAFNFIHRLNAVAFWGSVGHYRTGGGSFVSSSFFGLKYFLRGLQLADSVWMRDKYTSSALYGDPLYSPVSVRLMHASLDESPKSDSLSLFGTTLNGKLPQVNTTYTVSYCDQAFVEDCDQQNGWTNIIMNGNGKSGEFGLMTSANASYMQRTNYLGEFDVSNLIVGNDYLVRLAVESQFGGASHTFYDFYQFQHRNALAPTDVSHVSIFHSL